MTLKEEVRILVEELNFEIYDCTEISIKVMRNAETILNTILTLENAVLLFGDYKTKLIKNTMVFDYPSIEFVCLAPRYEQDQKEV